MDNYSTSTTGLDPKKVYYANWIVNPGTYTEGTINGVNVTWGATTALNIGSLKVELKDASDNSIVATSNEIDFTIKSIKNIKAQIPMFGGGGGVYTVDPCSSGSINLGAANISIPGTGTPPQNIYNWKWLVPSGWYIDGQLSNGSTFILRGQNVTVTYPASTTEGTIQVKAYQAVNGCTAEIQESIPSDAVSVSRVKSFTIASSRSYVYCGDHSPVTFTVTPVIPCAVYYWNGSQTSTTNNTCQLTPTGTGSLTATVNIVYDGLSVPKNKTVNFKPFPSNIAISGPSTVCTSGATYTINNIPAVSSITWTNGSYLTISSGQNTSSCTFRSTSTGDSWIQARVVTSCGKDTLLSFQYGVGSGIPVIDPQIPMQYYDGYTYNNVCNSQNYLTNINVYPTLFRHVEWSRIAANPSTTQWYQSGDNINLYFFAVGQTSAYRISATNDCGCTTNDFGFKSIDCSGGGGCNVVYALSPNPASNKITIAPQLPAPCGVVTTELAVTQSGTISVFDQQGSLKKKIKYSYNSEAEIDVSDLTNGTYIVQIYDGNSTDRKTIIVHH